MGTLLLQAVDVSSETSWRWLLTDAGSGALLADHQVALKIAGAEYEGLTDLAGYLRWRAIPDRRAESEAVLLARLGEWLGSDVFGAIGPAIVAAAPVTVQVLLSADQAFLLRSPLGLAQVDGVPLARQAGLAFGIPGELTGRRPPKQPVAEQLRMLAVFSMPATASAGSLRRERYHLSRRLRDLRDSSQRAIELRVLQYGVTRDRLQAVLEEGAGWDVVHLSGHGASAGSGIVLEHTDGSPDFLTAATLTSMLRTCRTRLKLVVISNNRPPSIGMAERRRSLGFRELPDSDYQENSQAGWPWLSLQGERGEPEPDSPLPLAVRLAERLDCAVLASRYPLAEEVTVGFNDRFYGDLFGRGQSVAIAACHALAAADAGPGTALLSAASPILIGPRAEDFRLTPPGRESRGENAAPARLAAFPGEPPRFVGRDNTMARAGAALAPESRYRGVLFHGLAGGGKTACALELAYRHQDSFAALAFWQAPTKDEEWASGLADFATRLDIQLSDYGFTMTSHIGTEAALRAFAPRLRRLLADAGILLVLDNLETLLTGEGAWRDPRWEILITALTAHDGESRVIMTSRTVPAALAATMITQPVHALSLDEAVALARELPNLRTLLHADAGPVRSAAPTVDADRDRVLRVLRLVQGHPKLMELADAAAADRDQLDRQLAAAERAAERYAAPEHSVTEDSAGELLSAGARPTGHPFAADSTEAPPAVGDTSAEHELDAFFRSGESTLDPGQFLAALSAWTVTALAALPAEARLMAEFVTCLEDADRQPDVIKATWAPLWHRLDRPGDPPEPDQLLAKLASAALIEAEHLSAVAQGVGAIDGREPMALRMHPGVAATVIDATDSGVREAVDAELAAFWQAVSAAAREREDRENSVLVVRAGLAGAAYLLRRGDWWIASILLEQATIRDESPGVAQAALPSLRRIAAATGRPIDAGKLAGVLRRIDPAEAERLLRGAVDAATTAGDYWAATVVAGQLSNLLMDTGRLGEALAVAEQKQDFTRQAGVGPWTQLADEARRLQLLGRMGDHTRVVAEVERLRVVMAGLPEHRGADETIASWNVREGIFSVGRFSAQATGKWAWCLELNAAVVASMRGRNAGEHEMLRTRFNDAAPLMRLGRFNEASQLLAECQRVFEEQADIANLAKVLTVRADLENSLGRRPSAANLQRTALRLSYTQSEPQDIAINHYNLALYLGRLGGDRAAQQAHRLAAGLVFHLTGMTHYLTETVRAVAAAIDGARGAETLLPSTVARVVELAEQTEGVQLGALLAALQPDPLKVEQALTEILRAAADAAA